MNRPTQFCAVCNHYHDLYYVQDTNGHLSLTVKCQLGPKKIAFVKGLMIPVVKSRAVLKREQQAKQLKLL